MGNSHPHNQTGKKATSQKIENAKKLGVLSLTEHDLESIPPQISSVVELRKLRTLDLSKNKLTQIHSLKVLTELKSINLDHNELQPGSLNVLVGCKKLQQLSASGNRLGGNTSTTRPIIMQLPTSIKSLSIASNSFSSFPQGILSKSFGKLEKLDLSGNQLAQLPAEIALLVTLTEILLDDNALTLLPERIGELKKLKVLSLRNNRITTGSNDNRPQPLPEKLFTDTALIDLNLHGNNMTNTQLNRFDGFEVFLERRKKVKSKTMSNLSVCGLS